jgi:thioredoxin reductase
MYDVIIIGAGAGGMAAGISSADLKMNALVIAKDIKLKSSGNEGLDFFDYTKLVKKFQQLVKNKQLEFKDKTEVVALEKNIVSFSVEVKSGAVFYGKSVLIAVGNSSLDFDHITQKSQDGKIKVDSLQKTSVPGVFAIGQLPGNIANNLLVVIGEGVKSVLAIKNLR